MMFFEFGLHGSSVADIEALLIRIGAGSRDGDGNLHMPEAQINYQGISVGQWVAGPVVVRGVTPDPVWQPAPGVYANARTWGSLKASLVADPTDRDDTRTDWQRSRFQSLQNAQTKPRGRTGDAEMPAGVEIDGVRIYPLDSVDGGITRKNRWEQ